MIDADQPRPATSAEARRDASDLGHGLRHPKRKMDVSIRSATRDPGDLEAIRRLLDYGVANGRVLPRPQREVDELIDEGHLYLADRDGKVVGMVALEVYSERLVEVRSLVVDPDWQRRKIGTLLVEECLREARRLGAREVLAITDRLEFFHRLGFARCLDGQEPLFLKL